MKRFLITRLSAIGDCIVTVPLANAIKDTYPDAFVAWAIGNAPGKLLKGHASVDEFITVDKRWMKRPGDHLSLRRRLRDLQFDAVIDPQGLTKSAMLGWYSGAKQRIGFAKPQGRELSLLLNNEKLKPEGTHIVEQQLSLLRPLGVKNPTVRFDLPREPAAVERIGQLAEEEFEGAGYAVINPGAGWESRLWPPERYASVATFLKSEYTLPTMVVWSGEGEREMAERIVAEAKGACHLAPNTSLHELSELLRRAAIYIGSDTGPTHLAAAVGTACVCLCGPTRGEYSGPYGSQHIIRQVRYQAGSSRQRRGADNSAMLAITVESVTDACRDIIERPPHQAAA